MKQSLITMAVAMALLAASGLNAATVINGVPIPDDVMAIARQAVASNSPQEALTRPDNPFAAHPLFQQLFARLDFKKVNEQAAQLMVQTFTVDEMRALVAFQASPVGKSINLKMPGYQQLVGGMVQNELKAAMEGYVLSQRPQGAQSPGVAQPPAAPKPVVPWTPPATPAATPAGTGGTPIGK